MTSTRKIALVTGGSRGLGRNAVLHLAENGIDSIFTYRSSEAEAKKLLKEIEARGGHGAALQLDTAETKSFADFTTQVKTVLRDGWDLAGRIPKALMGLQQAIDSHFE